MLRLFCVGAIICCVSVATLAQQATSPAAPPTTSDPQAVALVQRALAALAGSVAVFDVTLVGTAHWTVGSEDEVGTANLNAMAPAYSKMSLSLPSGTRMEIRNPLGTPLSGATPIPLPASAGPQPVGAWSGPDGVVHAMAFHNLMTDATWFFPALTLGRLASSSSYILSYLGQENHEGSNVAHVSACIALSPDANGPQYLLSAVEHLTNIDIYLDVTTLLPVSLSFDTHLENNLFVDIPIEIRFSGYQSVNGVQVPFHLQKYQNNGLVLDLQFNGATLNSGLTATSFQIQ